MRSSPLGISKTKLSQLENDKGFITNAVQDLQYYLTAQDVNDALAGKQPVGDYLESADLDKYAKTEDIIRDYYKKSETMSAEEITEKLGTLISVEFAATISEVVKEKVIYFIQSDQGVDNTYNEYMLINGKPELIGTTAIDLTGYAKEEYVQNYIELQDFAKNSELSNVAKTGSYNDLVDKPKIPSKSTDLSDTDTLVRKDYLDEQLQSHKGSNNKRLVNIQIPAKNWTKDINTPLPDFPFRSDIPVDGVNEQDWKIIDFYTTEYFTGKMSPIVAVYDNKISFWASEVINNAVTIDTVDLISILANETISPVPPEYTYNISINASNGVASSDKPNYKGDEIAKVSFTPNDDYIFDYLILDNTEPNKDQTNPISIPIDYQNHSLQVFFVRKVYKIDINVSNGTAELNKSEYFGDETATVTFTPNQGFKFKCLSINGQENQTDITSPLSLPINKQNHTIDIHFEKIYKVEVITHNGSFELNKNEYIGDDTALISFTPNPNYTLDYIVIDDGEQQRDIQSPLSIPINNANHKVEIWFKENGYTVTCISDGNGRIEQNKQFYTGSETAVISFIPYNGYEFDYATVDGSTSRITTNPYNLIINNKNHTVHSYFKKKEYVVTVKGYNGTVQRNQNYYYATDTAVISFTPYSGYEFDYALIDGFKNTNISSPYSLNINYDNHNVEVYFKMKLYTVDVTAYNGTAYTDKSDYTGTSTAKIYFSPDDGYEFDYLTVDNGSHLTGKTSPYSLSINQRNHNVQIYFKKKLYKLTATSTTGGKVQLDKTSYYGDETAKITLIPQDGYRVDKLEIDGQVCELDDTHSYYLSMNNSAHTIKGYFKAGLYENGELVKFGTLWADGTSHPCPDGLSYRETQNTVYNPSPETIEIKDTIPNKELQWRYVELDGKKMFVCDRNIVHGNTWFELYENGYIYGKNIQIDGKWYKIRSLTGGLEYKKDSYGHSYSDNLTNEWNKIMNGIGVANGTDDIWHWGILSFCQEEGYMKSLSDNTFDDSYKVTVRGGNAELGEGELNFYEVAYIHTRDPEIGFRPVLEILDASPTEPKYTNGQLVKLGSLWKDASDEYSREACQIPTKTNSDGSLIIDLYESQLYRNTIQNTIPNKEIQWRYVELDGKKMFVCDRNIAEITDTGYINNEGVDYDTGFEILIDGKQYLLRLPTGGTDPNDKDNDWDKIISRGIGSASSSNTVWHWKGNGANRTLCSEQITNPNSEDAYNYKWRPLRGGTSASKYAYYDTLNTENTTLNEVGGFRPILEILE